MKRAGSLIAAVVMMAGVLVQAATQSPAASPTISGNITGSWTMTIVNRSEPVNLELKADGEKVSGRFAGLPIVGEFKDGQLVFADSPSWAARRAGALGSDDAVEMYVTVSTAHLAADGTLAGSSDVFIRGYGSKPVKRMSWTAARAPVK